MKENISFHERKYLFSRKKIFIFTKENIYFHEKNLETINPTIL